MVCITVIVTLLLSYANSHNDWFKNTWLFTALLGLSSIAFAATT